MSRHRRASHHYQVDPITMPLITSQQRCTCGMPKANSVHRVPETTPEARERDAAVLGEKEEA